MVRPETDHGVATLTRESHEGVIASLELDRMWTSVSDTLPVEIGIWLGVGYTPALALMPVLTLRPTVALVNAAGPSNAPGQTFVLSSLADVPATSNQVVAFVNQHAMGFAEQFLDAPPSPRQCDENLIAVETIVPTRMSSTQPRDT